MQLEQKRVLQVQKDIPNIFVKSLLKIYLNIILFGRQRLTKQILLTRGMSVSTVAMTVGTVRPMAVMPYVFVSVRDSNFCIL